MKRSLSSKFESPSKRCKKFDDLVTFFGGSARVVQKSISRENTQQLLPVCLKDATLQTRQMGETQTKTLSNMDFVGKDETLIVKGKSGAEGK